MVQRHHQALSIPGEMEDGVHVEVVLGEFVVRDSGGAEDGDRLPPPVGEYDIPPEVVPGNEVAQVCDSPDALRLGVPHADLGVSVHLNRGRFPTPPSHQLVQQAHRLLGLQPGQATAARRGTSGPATESRGDVTRSL